MYKVQEHWAIHQSGPQGLTMRLRNISARTRIEMPEYLAELMMCDRGTLSGCCMHNISPAQRILVTRAMDAGTPGSNPTILMGSSCKAAQGSTAGQGP